MENNIFNVLLMDINKNSVIAYDVLPYFRCEWKVSPYVWGDKYEKIEVKDKETLKQWVKNKSRSQFWAQCEYEILIGKWPFGSYRMNEEIMEYLNNNPNFDMKNYENNIDFNNIIIRDMSKIDVHDQIMMNIDIITDILAVEFKIEK